MDFSLPPSTITQQGDTTIYLFRFLKSFFTTGGKTLPRAFQHVTGVWLTYLQPWCFTTEEINQKNDKIKNNSACATISFWEPYITNNWSFYTIILQDAFSFITNNFEPELAQRLEEVRAINSITSLYSNDKFLNLLLKIDNSLQLEQTKSMNRTALKSQQVKAFFTQRFVSMSLEGLYLKIGKILHQPSRYYNQKPQAETKLIVEMLGQIFIQLDFIINYINHMRVQQATTVTSSFQQSMLQQQLSPINKPIQMTTTSQASTSAVEDVNSIPIEESSIYVQKEDIIPTTAAADADTFTCSSPKLTPTAKNAVVSGLKKCEKKDLVYLGNKIYDSPPTSREIAPLVPYAISLSRTLNNKLKALDPNHTPSNDINLRVLVTYQAITFLIFSILFIYLFVTRII